MLRGKARMIWHRQVQQWHWISAAVCLAALLLFSVTGITLNHSAAIGGSPEVTTREGMLPGPLLAGLADLATAPEPELPPQLVTWLKSDLGMRPDRGTVEWSDEEILVSTPGPGRDTWVSLDLVSGEWLYENTWRGAIAWMNDLHKGRNTGGVWQLFIDLVAVACLIFAITGLFLLQLAARQRRSTWPLVGGGVALMVLMMVFFVH